MNEAINEAMLEQEGCYTENVLLKAFNKEISCENVIKKIKSSAWSQMRVAS